MAILDVAGAPSVVIGKDAHQSWFARMEKGAPDRLDGLGEPAVSVHNEEARAQQGQSGAQRASGTEGAISVVAVDDGEAESMTVTGKVFDLAAEVAAAQDDFAETIDLKAAQLVGEKWFTCHDHE